MKIETPKFANKKELYAYLVANKKAIYELKRSELKRCDPIAAADREGIETKAITDSSRDTDAVIHRTIVGNTYWWMDSHDDVHVSGIFSVSIKQRGAKRISHLHDHIHQLTAKVGEFEKVYEAPIAWRDLGVDLDGDTEALFADSSIKRSLNEAIFNMYRDAQIDQHSVGMRYVVLSLAVNDPDYKEEYAEWEKYIDLIGNKDEVKRQGYFYAIKEAKLIEISCVLNGSNELTPTLPVKSPSSDSSEGKSDPLMKQSTERKTKGLIYQII